MSLLRSVQVCPNWRGRQVDQVWLQRSVVNERGDVVVAPTSEWTIKRWDSYDDPTLIPFKSWCLVSQTSCMLQLSV